MLKFYLNLNFTKIRNRHPHEAGGRLSDSQLQVDDDFNRQL